MHFFNQTFYFFLFCFITLLFFSLNKVILTHATSFSSLNLPKKKIEHHFLLNYGHNFSVLHAQSLKLENILLQQLVEKEENLPESKDDNINGTNTAIFWWAPYSTSPSDDKWELSAAGNSFPLNGKANANAGVDQQVRPKRTIRWKRARTNKHEIRKCSMHTFEKCLVMMQEVMQNSSLAFPTNVDDLETTCKKLKAGDYCAEKYIRSCAGDQQRLLYQDIVQGTKNVIRLICQQGETQQLYLEFASCFKDIFVSEVKCSTVLARFQDISKQLSAGPSPSTGSEHNSIGKIAVEERLKQFCCAYRDVVDCQFKNVRKFCGVKGLEFFERYMGEMTNSLINEHCIGYTFHDKCRPYQQDLTKTEKNIKSAVVSNDNKDSKDEKSSRIKSKLIHNSNNTHTSGSISLHSISIFPTHITFLAFFGLFISIEACSKVIACLIKTRIVY